MLRRMKAQGDPQRGTRVWFTLSLVSALGVVVSCGSDDSDDGTTGSGGSSGSSGGKGGSSGASSSGGSSAGTSSSGGTSAGTSSSGGSSAGTSSSGGSTSTGGGGSGGAVGGGGNGQGGAPACELTNCLRPYECVEECGGPVLSNTCCPCEPPTFDAFTECRGEGGSGS
jgi:hypothetical protein